MDPLSEGILKTLVDDVILFVGISDAAGCVEVFVFVTSLSGSSLLARCSRMCWLSFVTEWPLSMGGFGTDALVVSPFILTFPRSMATLLSLVMGSSASWSLPSSVISLDKDRRFRGDTI